MTPELEYARAAQKWAADVLEWAAGPRTQDDTGETIGDSGNNNPPPPPPPPPRG